MNISKNDRYKWTGNNLLDQKDDPKTVMLIEKYNKFDDFKAVVDIFISREKKDRGHCGAVQDAAELAGIFVYNGFVKSNV